MGISVVERRIRLQEMNRTMLNEQSLPQTFWCNAVNTSTCILNRILIRAFLGKAPYELLRGRKPTLDYFRVFRKSLNVTFDETPSPSKTSPLVDDDLDEEEAIKVTINKNLENDNEDKTFEIDEIVNIKESRNHPIENIIGNLNQRSLSLVTCVHNKKTINVDDNEILNREIQHHMSSWVEIIRENVFCLRGHHDHVSACLCHMLYCIETSTKYNLAFFILKRMESIRNTPKAILPYGMLLTRLFTHIMSNLPESSNDRYILCDRVTHPLGPHYEQKTRSDHGTKRCRSSNPSSSSNVLDHPSSHHIDENNDGNN
ncbi:retrovirus-related pol polyprotein from transposon TNT 1-94 [Tanacetum coccineum]